MHYVRSFSSKTLIQAGALQLQLSRPATHSVAVGGQQAVSEISAYSPQLPFGTTQMTQKGKYFK